MEIKLFVLLMMIFFHILDDYVLQASCLYKLKQRKFWEENYPNEMYKYDYIVALILHGFSWSIMISIPAIIYGYITKGAEIITYGILAIIVFNAIFHAAIDHTKANLYQFNLIQDQIFHLIQVAFLWANIIN